jgi:hypothetical protein
MAWHFRGRCGDRTVVSPRQRHRRRSFRRQDSGYSIDGHWRRLRRRFLSASSVKQPADPSLNEIITLKGHHCMDNALDSMSQHELLAELDSVERAIGRTAAFARRTDEVGQTRVRISQELLALAEREYLIVTELRRRRQMQLAA